MNPSIVPKIPHGRMLKQLLVQKNSSTESRRFAQDVFSGWKKAETRYDIGEQY